MRVKLLQIGHLGLTTCPGFAHLSVQSHQGVDFVGCKLAENPEATLVASSAAKGVLEAVVGTLLQQGMQCKF